MWFCPKKLCFRSTTDLCQSCSFSPNCSRRLCCISFGARGLTTISVITSSLLTVRTTVNFQSAYRTHHSTETALLDVTNGLLGRVLMKARFPVWLYLICQLRSIRWAIAVSSHGCVTCSAYLARFSKGLHRTWSVQAAIVPVWSVQAAIVPVWSVQTVSVNGPVSS